MNSGVQLDSLIGLDWGGECIQVENSIKKSTDTCWESGINSSEFLATGK